MRQLKRKNYGTDSEFFKAVGKTFKANPKFFIESIHRRLTEKVSKKYGDERRREMERNIIENYCLYDEKHILFECEGSVDLATNRYKISAHSGGIFVTNQRITAQGSIRIAAYGGGAFARKTNGKRGSVAGDLATEAAIEFVPVVGAIAGTIFLFAPSGVKEAKKKFIDFSVQQELPCYGYIFPVKNLFNLTKKRRSINYFLTQGIKTYNIKISSPSFKTGENMDNLFEILFNEQTTNK